MLCVLIDIMECKKVEEKFRIFEKFVVVGEFVVGVVYEIKNFLMFLKGFVYLLKE